VQEKPQKIVQLVQKLASASTNKAKGIEVYELQQQQQLIELLRMCTAEEIKRVQQGLERASSSGPEQQKLNEILADALAAAGTKNTVSAFVAMIHDKKISMGKASQSLKNLNGLPAPSPAQVGSGVDGFGFFKFHFLNFQLFKNPLPNPPTPSPNCRSTPSWPCARTR
jgi:Lipoprotein amino terminal region